MIAFIGAVADGLSTHNRAVNPVLPMQDAALDKITGGAFQPTRQALKQAPQPFDQFSPFWFRDVFAYNLSLTVWIGQSGQLVAFGAQC